LIPEKEYYSRNMRLQNNLEDEETKKLFRQYEVMLKLFRAHLKDCPKFAKQVKESGEFESE
jgi:hypothetical protein